MYGEPLAELACINNLGSFSHIGEGDQRFAQRRQIQEQSAQQGHNRQPCENQQLLHDHILQRSRAYTHLQQHSGLLRLAEIHEYGQMLAAVRCRNEPVAAIRLVRGVLQQIIVFGIG
ncbi:hypothetical protein D3C73_730840 [compost metagenome]